MSKADSLQTQELYKIVSQRILAAPQERITFAEYMDLALYHPDKGYYASGAVGIGKEGDFFTAASLGADFGELLAIQIVEMWHKLGCPEAFSVVEMGAGNGSLAADIISYLLSQETEFITALRYIIIEKSPALRKIQQQRLEKYQLIAWQDWQDILHSSVVGCMLSNELVDAFPVHLVTKQEELKEVYLTSEDCTLKEIAGEFSNSRIKDYFELIEIDLTEDKYPEGYKTEVNIAALDWLGTVSSKLQQGYIITIDYGYDAPRYYHPQRSQGTLQCYYQHRRHNNPYVNLGQQDITSHVNFTALQNYGEKLDLDTIGFIKQGLFLMALGLGDRLSELSSGKFNAIEIFQRRDALHQLIDPMGLGGFGVLVQGKGLTREQTSLRGTTIPQ